MEELKKFQSSTFDTTARRRLVEDRDTILELSGKIQELQNEINCMNDSRDFQDAESLRSGHFPRCQSTCVFPTSSSSWRNAKPFYRIAEQQQYAARNWGRTWYIGKRFCKSNSVIFSILSAGIESMEFIDRGAASLIHSGKEWEASPDRQPKIQSSPVREISQSIVGRPTTTADFRSSFWQIPYTSHVCLLEDEIQDWGMYLFTNSFRRYAVDQRSGVGWFSGWSQIFVFCKRNSHAEFWSTRYEDVSALNRIIHNSHFKRRVSLEEQKVQKEDRFLRGGQIAYLIYDYFRVTGANDSVENYADLFTIARRNDDIQEFDS